MGRGAGSREQGVGRMEKGAGGNQDYKDSETFKGGYTGKSPETPIRLIPARF